MKPEVCLKFNKKNVTDEKIMEVCKVVGVDHFIKTLPNGYNSILSDDTSGVSAGQKQLLTIARVILADPKILILVMNHGDIVEQGTHEELLSKGGFYEKLYNSQFDVCEDEE